MENLIYLPEIKEDKTKINIVKLHWVVDNCAIVNKGDLVMDVETNLGNTYHITAHRSGILIRFLVKDVNVEKGELSSKEYKISEMSKVCIGGVFDSEKDFVNAFYKYKADVCVDDFTNKKHISWIHVANPIYRINSCSNSCNSFSDIKMSRINVARKDFSYTRLYDRNGILINGSVSDGIYFSFIFDGDLSCIEFSYSQSEIKFKKMDSISILFDNGNVSEFILRSSPYKKYENSKIRYFKCQLFAEDMENLTNSLAQKMKISFSDDQKPPINGDLDKRGVHIIGEKSLLSIIDWNNYFDEMMWTSYHIQRYAQYYVKVLKKEMPGYEHPKKTVENKHTENGIIAFDWCYVYLMKDFANNYYKIGMSNTPEYRERTLQSEKPTIEMICNKKLPSRKIAEAFEKALHHAFADKRIRGEWFDLDENDVAQIVESLK